MYEFIKVDFHLPKTVWLGTLLNDQTISTLSKINDKSLIWHDSLRGDSQVLVTLLKQKRQHVVLIGADINSG